VKVKYKYANAAGECQVLICKMPKNKTSTCCM